MTDAFRNQRTPFAQPKAPKTPAGPKPRITRPKAPNVNQVATQNAMGAFRTALAQLKASTPAVDANAIYAPYRASEQITGQLGQGLQQSELNSGQAAQTQYNTALGQAQQQAAQFGISAGAGANPTALQNTGAQPLAQQTNAYAAAAPQAAAQWQQLLERTAAAKVSDAGIAREQGLTTARQSLAASLPTAIGNEEDRAFQRRTQKFNEDLAKTQLTQKQVDDLRRYNLDVTKANNTTVDAGNKSALDTRKYNETVRHDKATERGARIRARRAAASGVKGMPQVLAALKMSASTKPTTGAYRGWSVQVQPLDSSGNPLGPVVEKHGPRKDWAPPGYRNVGGATPYYDKNAPGTSGTTPVRTRAQWEQAVGIYASYNGVSRAEAAKAVQRITPRPPK